MSKSFDRIASTYDATRGGEARGRAIAKDIHPLFAQPGPVFEIGIGTGVVALGLHELGRPVTGVDIGIEMAKRAVQRIGPRVVQGDATCLPIRSQSVADACSVMVLHLVDVELVMREVARVLRLGGRYVVTVGSHREPLAPEVIEAEMHRALRSGSGSRIGPTRITELAEAAGLRPVDRVLGTPQSYGVTPEKAARRIEERSDSVLWDVDHETWERIVEPAIAKIRALPNPDVRLFGEARQRILVFER